MSKGEIGVYRRHGPRPGFRLPKGRLRARPESTALYEVVRDNIETLFGAIDDGGLAVRIPKHARQELVAYLDCGLLCPPRGGCAPVASPGSNAVGAARLGSWLSVARGAGFARRGPRTSCNESSGI